MGGLLFSDLPTCEEAVAYAFPTKKKEKMCATDLFDPSTPMGQYRWAKLMVSEDEDLQALLKEATGYGYKDFAFEVCKKGILG